MTVVSNDNFIYILGLKACDEVEVKSIDEILSTLDDKGNLDLLPFMPEMKKFCGKRFKVYKRADKTCDTIFQTGGRRLYHTVHLEDVRCDGQLHGGCDASCLIFWKEAWLKLPEAENKADVTNSIIPVSGDTKIKPCNDVCSEEAIRASSILESDQNDGDYYSCQTTRLYEATAPLPWWDLRQYLNDLRSGNVKPGRMLNTFLFTAYKKLLLKGIGYNLLRSIYKKIHRVMKWGEWPYEQGKCVGKTPSQTVNIQPGDWVEVKSYGEILETINTKNRNRGLSFDAEMVPYCGKKFRVLKRVEHMLEERTGKLVKLPNDCMILDGVVCQSGYSDRRLFCPRSIYPYWREIWLNRVDE